MLPEDLEDRILKIQESLPEMAVKLSTVPQVEPFSYIHEKVAEIHRHSSYLTDLIVEANRWKAQIDHLVERQKQITDFKFNEILIHDTEVRRKKSVGERKSAASLQVQGEQEELLELKRLQLEVVQLSKSLTRKANELKGKSIDLKFQGKVLELEWAHAGKGHGGSSGSQYAPAPAQRYDPEEEEEDSLDQSPTAEDLDLLEVIEADSISKKSSLSTSVDSVEEVSGGLVEVSKVSGGLESLTSVAEEELEELPVDESPVPSLPAFQVETQDLDALLEEAFPSKASVRDELDKVLDEVTEGGAEKPEINQSPVEAPKPEPPPERKVGEVEDFDALLDSF